MDQRYLRPARPNVWGLCWRQGGVPGVVILATDIHDNFYEGAAGRRSINAAQPMKQWPALPRVHFPDNLFHLPQDHWLWLVV